MGSYGIGVERAMASIIECHHDDKGIIWPLSVAPFQVAIVVAQSDNSDTAKVGETCTPARRSGVESSSMTASTGRGSSSAMWS